MSTDKPSPSEPLYLVLLRKLVLLLLVMVASAIGLVALLLQARLKIPILAFLLTDIAMGLVAGFSARWIIPNKARLLRSSQPCCSSPAGWLYWAGLADGLLESISSELAKLD